MEHPFIKKYDSAHVDVASWFAGILRRNYGVPRRCISQETPISYMPETSRLPPSQSNPSNIDAQNNGYSWTGNPLTLESDSPSGFRMYNPNRSRGSQSAQTTPMNYRSPPQSAAKTPTSLSAQASPRNDQSPRQSKGGASRFLSELFSGSSFRNADRKSPDKSGQRITNLCDSSPRRETKRTLPSHHSYDNASYSTYITSPSARRNFRDGSPVVPPRRFLSREPSPISPIPPRRMSRENSPVSSQRMPYEQWSPGYQSPHLYAVKSPSPTSRRVFQNESSPFRRMNSQESPSPNGLQRLYVPPASAPPVRRRFSDSSEPMSPPQRDPYSSRSKYTPEPTRKFFANY